MKEYPSIPGVKKAKMGLGLPCVAFNKYDGSNLRWEWNSKSGWCKSGTRTQMFDKTHEVFGSAIDIFQSTLAEPLAKVFKEKEFRESKKIVVFTEFYGKNSFAGLHEVSDPKELILFDVRLEKKGIIGPKMFLEYFGHLRVPEVIYTGNLNHDFIDSVRNNKLGLDEGVVCKGGSIGRDVWMVKVKTLDYLERLKSKCESNWEQYWE